MGSKRSGRYCRLCGRRRPNEAFSGRGHARCICRECESYRRARASRPEESSSLRPAVAHEVRVGQRRRRMGIGLLLSFGLDRLAEKAESSPRWMNSRPSSESPPRTAHPRPQPGSFSLSSSAIPSRWSTQPSGVRLRPKVKESHSARSKPRNRSWMGRAVRRAPSYERATPPAPPSCRRRDTPRSRQAPAT